MSDKKRAYSFPAPQQHEEIEMLPVPAEVLEMLDFQEQMREMIAKITACRRLPT